MAARERAEFHEEFEIGKTDQILEDFQADDRRTQEIVGPCEVHWDDGLCRMVEDRHPDWLVD